MLIYLYIFTIKKRKVELMVKISVGPLQYQLHKGLGYLKE